MTNSGDGALGDTDPSGEEPGVRWIPATSPLNEAVDEPTSSKAVPPVVYDPLPTSRGDTAREKRALRHAYHVRTMPSWVRKIPWVIFPLYGYLRRNDPNYEEHFEQWQEQQRRNYSGREEQ
jgi:hypothetical protein